MNPRHDSAIAGIDHVLLGARDLEAARAAWQGLGFTVTPRGRHIGWGTANYCIMLARGYIELLGIVDPAQFTNSLDTFLAGREGLLGVAFASTDSTRTLEALALAGLHPDGPKDLKRILELPDGDVQPAFSLVLLPRAETPGLTAFFCQHLTPDLIRRPAWVRHANGTRRLAGVTIVAADPQTLARGYAPIFGADAVSAGDAGWWVDTGGGWLRFVTPEEFRRLYGNAAALMPPLPWLAAVTLERDGPREIIAPERASGAIVELVPG